MSILIVVSNRTEINRLRKTLNDSGFEHTLEARSIGEALTTLSANNPSDLAAPVSIDLILMDVVMPDDMDAIAVCGFIKGTPHLSDIPIIMLSPERASAQLEAAFEAGAHDYLVAPFHPAEITARVKAALRFKRETDARRERERELQQLATELESANEELKRVSGEDSLTRIANRRRFDELLHNELRSHIRRRTGMALLLLDVDHFKLFNDGYGHKAGDVCLKMIADQIKHTLRRSTDRAARYGGEEFAVILPDTDEAGALAVSERIRSGIEGLGIPHAHSPSGMVVTASIGCISLTPAHSTTESLLVQTADAQLYLAKDRGRNRTCATTELIKSG